ncbi:hypothetical protein RRSWK_02305 [Rhodopirellula sp. SWK7]|nr:hypothetical protein RRSWK_02305 [Rhodopirellula sp. SWK7]
MGIFPITKDDLSGAKPRFRYIPKRWPDLWQSFVKRNETPVAFDSTTIESLGFCVTPPDDSRPSAIFSLAGHDGDYAILHGEFFNHHAKLFLFQRGDDWTLLEEQLVWLT